VLQLQCGRGTEATSSSHEHLATTVAVSGPSSSNDEMMQVSGDVELRKDTQPEKMQPKVFENKEILQLEPILTSSVSINNEELEAGVAFIATDDTGPLE